MRSLIKCQGFIFDVDATLVDTTTVINNIWKSWATKKNIGFELVYPHIHGRKVNETLKAIDPRYENICEETEIKIIAREQMSSARAIDGALDFVSSIPLSKWAIATSGPRAIATTSLKASGFPAPSNMICGEDVCKGKPDPEPFTRAADLLGVSPKECVAFEDSPAGVKSAKSAGCFTIALKTSHETDALAEADLLVDTFENISIHKESDGFILTEI
ncbi:HAD-IA family hydrolase [Dongshaea marina]|uniref:HAD-IA family hydrolase n=1 Tax=Dongshaea marina TaxID=2047966 RepID=UPI000D3E9992|nr:HAD-IA family hydrolase [Dongshaea marina]